ncbi:hypothetical protein SK128_022899 [Halocaridina rubra]|uniref:L-Fucosyltransferase n=1 Tax=Halocaridina rubra TaxID=373956 RepID=A0AAN9A708_HALRR
MYGSLGCPRGYGRWWLKILAVGWMMLVMWVAVFIIHAQGEYDESTKSSTSAASSTVTSKDQSIYSNWSKSFLDYDTVYTNSSDVNFPLIVFTTVGRLGNCLNSYATALTFADRFNATIAVSQEIFLSISTLLAPQYLTLPVIASELVVDAYDMGVLETVTPDYIKDDMVSHLLPAIQNAISQYQQNHEQILYLLEGYPNRMKMLSGYHDKIRQNFRIRDDLKEKALLFLKNLRDQMSTKPTFIGFHIRRGDYLNFMETFFKCKIPNETFYLAALKYYRSRFPNAVFVVCSDDVEHMHKNLAGASDIIFSSMS